MKKLGCFIFATLLLLFPLTYLSVGAKEVKTQTVDTAYTLNLNAKSAFLMDYTTGTVLYEQNADERLPLASVTKIMTLLLVMEAIQDGRLSLNETVTVSEHAASMGGSQIFLEPGEKMSVEDLLKSVVISSANDAACALAEHIAGSEEAFVSAMNQKAKMLGMNDTNFENTNGLDDTATEHYSSARDIAVMSRALMAHPKILEYSSIWMDTIRDGAFGLSNTNRLIRFYPGATGLKTGSTEKAKFCISATALRNGMHLIAVVMGAETRDIRNAETKKLLDYGFANYGLYTSEVPLLDPIKVLGGTKEEIKVEAENFAAIIGKGDAKNVTVKITLEESLNAPITAGQAVGSVSFFADGKLIGKCNIVTKETVEKISYTQLLYRMVKSFLFP
ncbi:MAG: D-alanyl-D-alanine carboxypeptidase [Clostridia bacterium]|nr:D-alanyl-D-alanine carboxypeptidase [Clostridia bacterium]